MVVSGDQDQNGYKQSMHDMPWVAIPFKSDASSINAKVPCTGYPTPGVVNGQTGNVIDADVFGKVGEASLAEWLQKC